MSEIAALLGVSRQRAHKISGVYADFPAPQATLPGGRIWLRADVERWLKAHPDRPPGRRPSTAG